MAQRCVSHLFFNQKYFALIRGYLAEKIFPRGYITEKRLRTNWLRIRSVLRQAALKVMMNVENRTSCTVFQVTCFKRDVNEEAINVLLKQLKTNQHEKTSLP